MSYPVFSLLLATALLARVAGWDIARRRIPNWANAALGATGLAAQAIHNGGWAVASGVAAGAITLAVLWVPWSKGRLGGGGVKATICAATWLGLAPLFKFYLFAALASGVVSAACFLASGKAARQEIRQNLHLVLVRVGLPEAPIRGGVGRVSVPFGAAVAAAAALMLWWKP